MTTLMDKDGNRILDPEEKRHVWEEYVENLYTDERDNLHGVEDVKNGPEILPEEVCIRQLSNAKAPGLDNVHGELLKLVMIWASESSLDCLTVYTKREKSQGTGS